MAKYSVVKFFGHFRQDWEVYADSDEEAMTTAESKGVRRYQTMYATPFTDQKNYVINQDKRNIEDPPISKEQTREWMREAVEMGMIVTPREHEFIYGLPFSTIHR